MTFSGFVFFGTLKGSHWKMASVRDSFCSFRKKSLCFSLRLDIIRVSRINEEVIGNEAYGSRQ